MPQKQSASTDVLVDGIQHRRKGHHDTIYCNKSQANALKARVGPNLHPTTIDNLRFLGLDVETLPIKIPIVCQKGEVFPLAKDYKDGSL